MGLSEGTPNKTGAERVAEIEPKGFVASGNRQILECKKFQTFVIFLFTFQ